MKIFQEPSHFHRSVPTLFLLLLTLWLWSPPVGVGATLTADQLQDLRNFINSTVRCKKVPALVVSIVHGGSVLLSEGYGVADVQTQRRVTSRTALPIASLTKAFTSVLLAQLLEGKNLTWATPISRYLDESFRFSEDILNNQVSLEDILSHRTGLETVLLPIFVGWPESKDRTELVRELMKALRVVAPLRTSFSYSNLLYGLAGVIAEQLAGDSPARSWEDLVTEFIVRPLNMNSTGFMQDVQEGDMSGFALPYVKVGGENQLVDMIATTAKVTMHVPAAGAMYSTADDMAKWMKFLLSGGRDATGKLLVRDPRLYGAIFMGHMHNPKPFSSGYSYSKPDDPVDDFSHSYDLGWIDSVYRGYRKIWHSGSISTYSAVVWLFPHMRTGLFIAASNNDGPSGDAIYAIASYAADLLLGERAWLNESTACDFRARWTGGERVDFEKNFTASRPLEAYVGTYVAEPWQTITVYVNETDSMLYMTMGAIGHLRLYPTENGDVFLGKYLGSNFFLSDSDYQQMGATVQFKKSTEISSDRVDLLMLPSHIPTNPPTTYRLLTSPSPPGGGAITTVTESTTNTSSSCSHLSNLYLIICSIVYVKVLSYPT